MLTTAFTYIFVASLLTGLALKFWLSGRQLRHVAQHRGAVPEAFAKQISIKKHQKAADYTMAKLRLGTLELALGAAVLLLWTLMGGLNALQQFVHGFQWQGTLWPQVLLVLLFMLIGSGLDLPLSLYQTFVLEERFGFNKMTWKLWLVDGFKGLILGAVIGIPILLLMLWLMHSAGRMWWFWAWAVWMGFNLVLLVVYPAWIAPLFNQFKPLQDEALQKRVTNLMTRCGFASKGLFVMDGSKRSAHANAYFTGFGAAKRVVFYDTLLEKLTPGEVDAVLAHELGHFWHKHIVQRVVMMFCLSLLGFALLGWLMQQLWFYTALGVQPIFAADGGASNNALALLLFLMVVPVFSFFLTPISSWMSRKHEFQADRFAKEKTNGTDLASALLKLYEDNASTLTPDPIYAKFYYSHPPASERLAQLEK